MSLFLLSSRGSSLVIPLLLLAEVSHTARCTYTQYIRMYMVVRYREPQGFAKVHNIASKCRWYVFDDVDNNKTKRFITNRVKWLQQEGIKSMKKNLCFTKDFPKNTDGGNLRRSRLNSFKVQKLKHLIEVCNFIRKKHELCFDFRKKVP